MTDDPGRFALASRSRSTAPRVAQLLALLATSCRPAESAHPREPAPPSADLPPPGRTSGNEVEQTPLLVATSPPPAGTTNAEPPRTAEPRQNDACPSLAERAEPRRSAHEKRLVVGGFHTRAVLSDSRVTCWGSNDHGQLGDGTTASSPVPVFVSGLVDAAEAWAGHYRTCARRASGAVVCWGALVGQSGSGAPQTVMCWGANAHGQLGDGTTTGSRVPVDVKPPIAREAPLRVPSGTP